MSMTHFSKDMSTKKPKNGSTEKSHPQLVDVFFSGLPPGPTSLAKNVNQQWMYFYSIVDLIISLIFGWDKPKLREGVLAGRMV